VRFILVKASGLIFTHEELHHPSPCMLRDRGCEMESRHEDGGKFQCFKDERNTRVLLQFLSIAQIK